MNLDTYFSLRKLSAPALSADHKSVVFCLATLNEEQTEYISEIWRVEMSGDTQYCVHSSSASCTQPQLNEEGDLYFLSKGANKAEGKEGTTQVWRKKVGQAAVAITDEALGVSDYRIAKGRLVVLTDWYPEVPYDEQRVVATDRAKNGPSGRMYTGFPLRSWDHWTGGTYPHLIDYRQDGKRRDLCPEFREELTSSHGLAWDLSADGNTIAAVCLRPGPDRQEDSSIVVIDIGSAVHRHLGREEKLTHSCVRFSPDGSRIASVRHRRQQKKSGANKITVYETASGKSAVIADAWEVSPTIEDWKGADRLLVTTPENGQIPLYQVNISSGEVERISAAHAGGSHGAVISVGDSAVGIRHSFAEPPEVFSIVLEPDSEPRLLTHLSGVDGVKLQVESRSCAGDGGSQVQYFFLSDATASQSVERATLVWIHGGPVSSWTDGWHWRWNALLMVAAGYNLVLPNPRGSTGFGQEFIEGIAGNQWGAACYLDLMAVCDEVVQRPDVDKSKFVAMGGSFGGYMSNWIATQSGRFAAIITHASLYRLSAFQGTTDYPSYWAHDMGLYPSDSPDEFDKYSPHRYVDNWKTPTLIIHGEKDYRVPISEGLMLFEDLHRRGVDVSLLVFPTENHWIVHPRNSRQWYEECLSFLDTKLSVRG